MEAEGQYHFHMETQACRCVPLEDGFKLFSGTQWAHHVQANVGLVLNIPHNKYKIFDNNYHHYGQ